MSESNEAVDVESSAEDKFFGVRTTIVKSSAENPETKDSDIEIDIVDDRPVEDRRPPKVEVSGEEDDDELTGYSEKVQKRINKLRYEQNEERRQREAAERMREEAVRVAQTLSEKNKEYESIITRGEAALVQQIKGRAELALQQAKNTYKKAYEEGDTDTVVDSQEALYKAQAEMAEATKYERNLAAQQPARQQQNYQPAPQQQPQQQQPQQQQSQQPPPVDPEAKDWADKNTWFMSPDNKRMTATAYGLHEEAIVDNAIKPNTPEYFEFIDSGMREAYPKFGWQGTSDTDGRNATSTASNRSTVVASSGRNNGAKPRKVKLSSTQISLAKRIGVTPEQYARQLQKESLR